MKKIKGILLFTTLLVLLVGVVSATELSDNTIATNEVTQQAVQDTSSVSYDTGTKNTVTDVVNDKSIAAEDIQENTTLEDNKIVKNELKNVKKAGQHTYDVNNFNSLNDAIRNSDYDDVTINIESNIQLEELIVITDDTNKTLIINGNSHTINGSGNTQFLWIGSKWNVTINDLNFTNCHSDGHGGVIDNFGANITINNCNFTNNDAEYGGAINNQLNCTMVFNSCKFENNKATGESDEMGGGAIFNEDSTIILDNCTLTDNHAPFTGGAIYNKGTAIITNSMINKNSANKVYGGGAIYNWAGNLTIINSTLKDNEGLSGGSIYNSWATLTICNSTLENNEASKYGGAIFINYGTITINNSTLENNKAGDGGAIYSDRGTVIINNTTLKSNKVTNEDGGAIKHERGTMLIYNSIFENNKATYGAALYNYRGTTSIYNSEFNNNEGTYGGAISNGRTLTLSNSTFNKNKATYGGAIRNNGNLILSNSTFNKNSGTYGGVLYNNDSTSNITNTIFNNNSADYGGAIYSIKGIFYLYDSILRSNTADYPMMGGAIVNLDEAKIYRNKFITNQADRYDEAIKYMGDSVTVIGNTNAGDSKYGYTIVSTGDNVDICYNGFYLEPFSTNLIISTNNSNPKINDKINITCRLEDEFNFAIPDQYVKIIINDETEIRELTNADGIVSYEYTLTNKNEKIIAQYDGNKDYFEDTATLDISVPTDTQIHVEDVSAVVGQECRINGTLLDITGTPLMQETLYMTLDNHTYLLSTNEAGQFETTVAFFKAGKYDMLVTFNGSNDYYQSNQTKTVPVLSQANMDIEILNNTESNVQIEILATDETKTGIAEQEVIITLPNGTTTTQKTDTNGKIRITDKTATVGEKTVTAKIESTEELMGTTESKNIMVIPDYQKIIDNLINTIKEQNNTIKEQNNTINKLNNTVNNLNSTVQEQNRTINNLNNTVNKLDKQLKDANNKIDSLNNTVQEQNKTINNLNNTVNKLDKQLKDANNKISKLNSTVNDLNSQLNKANKQIKTLNNTVNKLTQQLKDANKTINSLNNTNKKLTQQLTDANKKINTLNETNKKLTNDLSKVNKQIKTLNATVNKLTKELKDAYKKIDYLTDVINKLTNKTKLNTTITINPIKSSVGSVVKLYADIIDEKGLPVKDGRVIFKINGKTLKDENDNVIYGIVSNGTASINYKVQNIWIRNTTTIQAVYSGSQKYTSSRTNSSDVLNISKGIATITLEKSNITAKVGETITLRAKVVDGNGDRINSSKVVFKLNGKSLCDNEGNVLYAKVVDGEAVLDYTLPYTYIAKTHNITAIFSGDYYERAETSGLLVLEKKGVTINIDNITTKGNKTRIRGTIIDETGSLLVKDTKLAVKINGKTILNNVTSKNSKIDVSFITSLSPGMYELLIISGQNGLYQSGKVTTVLKI